MHMSAASELPGMFKRSWTFVYEHMGNVFMMSALWLFSALTVVLIPVATATVYFIVSRLLAKEDVSFKDAIVAVRRFFWRSEALGLLLAALVAILVVDISFFATVPENALVRSVSGLMFWPLVFIVLASNYVIPLLVVCDLRVGEIAKRASLMVLDNLWYSVVLGLLSLALIVCAIAPPFLILAFAATLGCLQVQGTIALLGRYEGQEKPRPKRKAL